MTTIRDLWEAERKAGWECRQSCFCPVPEVCRENTPEQTVAMRIRREDAGIVQTETPHNGITVISWEEA